MITESTYRKHLGTMAVAAGLAAGVSLETTEAATITWGPATTISGDTDVSTNGTSLRAYTVQLGNTTTVNGVTFVPITSQAVDTIQNVHGGIPSNPLPGSLSADYQALLRGGVFEYSNNNGDQNNQLSITFNNLTAGHTYEVQTWVDDSRAGSGRIEQLLGINPPTLQFNTTNTDGGLGQFAVGTFVADSTSQTVFFSTATNPSQPFERSQTNGIQLRTLAIPEPASLGMLGVAGVGLLTLRRRD